MKITIIVIMLLALIGCGGTYDVNVEPTNGEITHTFGPDFENWLEYCKGQTQYRFDIGEITANEIEITTRECYYNLDLGLPLLEGDV